MPGDSRENSDDVKAALVEIGIDSMTILEGRGHGRQKGHTETDRGVEYQVDLLPKFKIELVVPDDRAEEAVRKLMTAPRTGKLGDGKIFVSEISDAFRIRTGDWGDAAL